MFTIRNVSDLENYNEVLNSVSNGNPVCLSENNEDKYVILTIEDYNSIKYTQDLYSELAKGYDSALKYGWCKCEDVEKELDNI